MPVGCDVLAMRKERHEHPVENVKNLVATTQIAKMRIHAKFYEMELAIGSSGIHVERKLSFDVPRNGNLLRVVVLILLFDVIRCSVLLSERIVLSNYISLQTAKYQFR